MKSAFREKALAEAKEDSTSTKARILKAAEDTFAREGFKGTTTRDIVEAADVNIALLHYHWGSKEELWNAVHHHLMSQLYEEVSKITSEIRDKDVMEALRLLVTMLFNFTADNPNISLLMQQPKLGRDRPWTRDVGVPAFNSVLDYVEANTVLDFGPVNSKLAVYMIVGAMEFFFIRPDLTELYFGEKSGSFSEEFREEAIEGVCTMIERFGRVAEKKQKN